MGGRDWRMAGCMLEFLGSEVPPLGEAVYTLLAERCLLARLPWLNPVSFRSSVPPPGEKSEVQNSPCVKQIRAFAQIRTENKRNFSHLVSFHFPHCDSSC